MNMVERMARAMHENECRRYAREPVDVWAWEARDEWQRGYWRAAALAALAAMRIPTPAMGRAAYAFADGSRSLQEGIMGPREAIGLWQAMIDCALAEGENAGSPQDTAAER